MVTIFDHDRSLKPQILTTSNPILFNLSHGFPPIADLPEGKIRIRLRADEMSPVVHVRTPESIRAFLIHIDAEGKLSRGPELAATYKQAATAHSVAPIQGLDKDLVIAEAQARASATGKKWVWYVVDDIHYHAKPADVLHHVQLNDVVLVGEIVVLEKPSRKEVFNLVWPELPRPVESATVTA